MSCTTVSAEEALTSRLLQSTVQALELFGVYLGKELGLYEAFEPDRALTAAELAARTGIAVRYAREWLEQQAVAGFLDVEQSAASPEERRYRLPAEHVNVLVAEGHPAHLAPLAQMVAGIGGALGHVLAAYRSGAGVAYPLFGDAFRRGQAGINRPAFTSDLVERWIPAAQDLYERLTSSALRVADVGCGGGWSTIAMARAFPQAEVIGLDADAASISDARRHAAAQNVPARFEVCDAAAIGQYGPFDLVLVLEALHDMARPADALRAMRETLTPGGAVLVADEKVAERFHAPGDEIERLMYGWSIVHCLPVAMSETPSDAIGTVIRSDIVKTLAREAGFGHVDVLPVNAGFFRIYRLSL
ncbi:MAG TPA: class I SAM-dependent methyltransferase [Vicinamibacterales bacterium]